MTPGSHGPTTAVVPRAVAIGGGHGQARTLVALQTLAAHVTAIGTVADDGGSSGRLRRDLGVLPPGDLRMALRTLATDPVVRSLLDHRFTRGELAGHSLGNLMIVAASELAADAVGGLDAVARLAGSSHTVLPSTTADVHLAATGVDGAPIVGQATIAATPGSTQHRLVGAAPVACREAVSAIEQADVVVLGPGSVVTSVLPNLLVPGIADAVARTAARVVVVSNLDEQDGEGEGRSIADHLDMYRRACPQLDVDVLVAHDGPAPHNGRTPLVVDAEAVARVGAVVTADLLDRSPTGGHDAEALTAALRRSLTAAS